MNNTSIVSDHFSLASCSCKMTEAGDFCDRVVDPCDVIGCFPGVSCDNGRGVKNPCGACPSGMVGDGITCNGNY